MVDDLSSTVLKRSLTSLGKHGRGCRCLPEIALDATALFGDDDFLNDVVDRGHSNLDVAHPSLLLIIIRTLDVQTVAVDVDDVTSVGDDIIQEGRGVIFAPRTSKISGSSILRDLVSVREEYIKSISAVFLGFSIFHCRHCICDGRTRGSLDYGRCGRCFIFLGVLGDDNRRRSRSVREVMRLGQAVEVLLD